MKINRLLPALIPFLLLIGLEAYFYRPAMVYVLLALAFVLYVFTIRQFVKAGDYRGRRHKLLILPLLFSISLVAFSTMVPSVLLLQMLFVLHTGFIYIYFRSLYLYIVRKEAGQRENLENLSSYGNFLAVYFLASSIYGLRVFLNLDITILMLAAIIFFTLIVYQVFWSNRIEHRRGLLYIFIIDLILVELAWAASFLTLSYYILGLVLAVCYYILIGLVRFNLQNKLSASVVRHYLVFGFLSIAIVLLTSRWVSI